MCLKSLNFSFYLLWFPFANYYQSFDFGLLQWFPLHVPVGLPSAPRHLRNLLTNQTTVSLSWAHSRHLGGRTDLFYEIECKILCREDQQSCSQDCGSQVLFDPQQANLSQTRVTVTNLFSRTAYRFKIYAKNGVSAVAEKEGFPSRFAKLDVTTLESGQYSWTNGLDYGGNSYWYKPRYSTESRYCRLTDITFDPVWDVRL